MLTSHLGEKDWEAKISILKITRLVNKLYLCLTKHHATKTYWGVEVSGQLHAPVALPPGKEPPVYDL
jgi:hypothetical protein